MKERLTPRPGTSHPGILCYAYGYRTTRGERTAYSSYSGDSRTQKYPFHRLTVS